MLTEAARWAGLTAAVASARLDADGPNRLPAPTTPSMARRLAGHAVEPLSLVLLVAAALSGTVLGHVLEAAAIVAIVALNVGIAGLEEDRADRAIASLDELTAPTARVRRDGVTVVIDAREVVRGDLVEVAAGDRVPADLAIVAAESLAADEAILTGESMPVDRVVGEALRAGTVVVRGHAVGVVEATGPATSLGQLVTALSRPVEAPLVGELRRVALVMSVVAVVLGGLLVPIVAVRATGDDGLAEAILAGVALAVAAIPEGLATIVTLSLALGARRMAGRGAIVRSLPALETLGATTLICADKTGTLTSGRVDVAAVHATTSDAALWRAALRCVDPADGTADPIDEAIAAAAALAGHRPTGRRTATRPFDAVTRSMATLTESDGGTILTIKGAPEVVLARCRAGAADDLAEAARAMTSDGLRVLAVAERPTNDLDAVDLEPVGLLAFADPIRPSAAGAVAACQRAGIRVVMVTGDHAATASAIAAAAGLEPGPTLRGDELDGLDGPGAAELLRRASIVARVLPGTKVALVDAHRGAGEIVAMTGDGVNDAPALRAADIGVALAGDSGTDVAREAADLVVTSGDLGVLVDAVREGRRIYRNISNVVGYLVTGNLSEILVFVGCLVVFPDLGAPLLPVQLLWLNLVSDGLPALALGVDRAATDPLAGPPRRLRDRLLSGPRLEMLTGRAVAIAVAVLAVTAWSKGRSWSDDAVRAELLLALLVTHLVFAYVTRSTDRTFERGWWRNPSLLLAIGGSIALQLPMYLTATGRDLLRLGAIPPVGWIAALGAAVGTVVAVDLARAAWSRR